MIHFYDAQTLPLSRWRKGGGETREIIRIPPDAENFSWRASIATITADGDFSLWPGIDRVIVLLTGDGIALHSDTTHSLILRQYQPYAFAGEESIKAKLTAGTSTDFNLMIRRATHQAQVRRVSEAFTPEPSGDGLVYVLSGTWQAGDRSLHQGQGVWWQPDDKGLFASNKDLWLQPASDDALLLLAEIVAS